MDDQEALVCLDRYHFQHHAVRIWSEEHDSIFFERRFLGRRLTDDRAGRLDDMTAALAAYSVF